MRTSPLLAVAVALSIGGQWPAPRQAAGAPDSGDSAAQREPLVRFAAP
jgi:hypothetical protein